MEYNFGFLDGDFWRHFNDDPLMHVLINEQFEVVRRAFLSLDKNTQNILDYFIIRKLNYEGIEVDLKKYIKRLANRYFDYYGPY